MGVRLVLSLSLLAAWGSSIMQDLHTEDGSIGTDVCDIEDGPEIECSLDGDGWMIPDDHAYYEIRPLQLGVEIRGISLHSNQTSAVITQLKRDAIRYRLLVFRDQGVLSPGRQVEVTSWFGEPDPADYGPHNPNEYIVRVANDKKEGDYGAGFSGFHIDGTYREKPLAFAFYHIINCTDSGNTEFVPLTEAVERMSAETRALMDSVWVHRDVANVDRPFSPIIYAHPNTSKPVMYVHAGSQKQYIWHYGTKYARRADSQEKSKLHKYTFQTLEVDGGTLVYSHKWLPGDFIVSDNLALAHRPAQAARKKKIDDSVALRVLHRSQVKGDVYPARRYAVPFDPPAHGNWQEGRMRLYWMRPLSLGVPIGGISLLDDPSLELIRELEMDLIRYQLLIFQNQGNIDNDRQKVIASWFGRPHKLSRNRADAAEEYITSEPMNGDVLWQSDSTHEGAPYPYKFMQLKGDPGKTEIITVFINLTRMVETMDIETRVSWERLWVVQSGDRLHPLIYTNPPSSAPVIYAFGSKERKFVWDYDSPGARPATDEETGHILHQKEELFRKAQKRRYKWSLGDFLIVDNRVLVHRTITNPSSEKVEVPDISCSYIEQEFQANKRYFEHRLTWTDRNDQ